MGSPSSRSMWKGDFSHSQAGDSKPQHAVPDKKYKKGQYLSYLIFLAWGWFGPASWLYMKRRGRTPAQTLDPRSARLFSGVVPTGFLKPKRWCFSGHIFLI